MKMSKPFCIKLSVNISKVNECKVSYRILWYRSLDEWNYPALLLGYSKCFFFLFYKEIIDAQCFLFYISLLNYAHIIIEIERNGSYLTQ